MSRHRDLDLNLVILNSQSVIPGAALSSVYNNMERVYRSRAHYGYHMMSAFQLGTDSEWTRYRDPFDNQDLCSDSVFWQMAKV